MINRTILLHSLFVYGTNIKRHFFKEFLLGFGLILSLILLILASTLSNGLNVILTSSVLTNIRVEEIKVVTNSIGLPDGSISRRSFSQTELTALEQIHGVRSVSPFALTTYPASAYFSIFSFNIHTEAVAEGINDEMASEYIPDSIRDKYLPEGWKQQSNGKVPVLLNSIIYKVFNRILSGIQGGQISKKLVEGFEFDIVFGKTVWKRESHWKDIPRKIRCVVVGFSHTKVCDLIAMPISVVNEYKMQWEGIVQPTYEGAFIEVEEARLVNEVYDALRNHNDFQIHTQEELDLIPIQIQLLKESQSQWQDLYNRLPDPPKTLNPSDPTEDDFPQFIPIMNQVVKQELVDLNVQIQTLTQRTNQPQFLFDEAYEQMRQNAEQLKRGASIFQILSYGLGLFILLLSAVAIFFAFMYLIIRREKEIGLYRFFGGTAIQVIGILTFEVFTVALSCALVGVILSYALISSVFPSLVGTVIQSYLKDFLDLISMSQDGYSASEPPIQQIFHFPTEQAFIFAGVTILVGSIAALIPILISIRANMLRRINK